MGFRASYLAAAMSLAFAASANAGLLGSTYDFSTSATGNTQISPLGGPTTHTDPANPGFCVGPPVACGSGSGVSGAFTFADVNATLSTITFSFSGSSSPSRTGSFVIDLGNFVTPDGSTITGITYASGVLLTGNFTNVVWDGTTATFTGTPGAVSPPNASYNAIGGVDVVFNVTLAPAAVPEPGSLALLGIALLGFGAARYRSSRV